MGLAFRSQCKRPRVHVCWARCYGGRSMVRKNSPTGLIATTRADLSPPLDDVVVRSRWPLMLSASPRRLARELSLHQPPCVLFWVEDRQSVAPTARLVAWSRERGP